VNAKSAKFSVPMFKVPDDRTTRSLALGDRDEPSSNFKPADETADKYNEPPPSAKVKVPAEDTPGAKLPPAFTVTLAFDVVMKPVPPSVAPLLTVTAPAPVAVPEVLFAIRVPALTVVPPVYALLPLSVVVKPPVLNNEPLPEIGARILMLP
jgi:hypothetical protein